MARTVAPSKGTAASKQEGTQYHSIAGTSVDFHFSHLHKGLVLRNWKSLVNQKMVQVSLKMIKRKRKSRKKMNL